MLKPAITCCAFLLMLAGCQSTPKPQHNQQLDILGTWHIEVIQSQPTIDYSPAQLTFATNNKLSGNNSCNTFVGSYALKNQHLTIETTGHTERACVDALMQQEQNMLQVLPEISQAEMLKGKLILRNDDGKSLLTLSRI